MRESTQSDSAACASQSAGAPLAVRKMPRVLIAEDELTFRALLQWAFEDDGCEVVTVADGRRLLDLLAASLVPGSGVEPFSLVVSDVRMPGWTGLAALEDLCRRPFVPPVVVVTAFGSEEVHRRAEDAGAVAVLDKPFDIEDLTALGQRAMSKHPV